ncbi:MAG: hypothetical protein GX811_09265 [Lentisphaerae bacterium]|nr:hypothetical protein [Lentisphaerota bacterium]
MRIVFISLLTGRSYTFIAKRYPFPVNEDAKGEIGYEYVNGNEYEESTVNKIAHSCLSASENTAFKSMDEHGLAWTSDCHIASSTLGPSFHTDLHPQFSFLTKIFLF